MILDSRWLIASQNIYHFIFSCTYSRVYQAYFSLLVQSKGNIDSCFLQHIFCRCLNMPLSHDSSAHTRLVIPKTVGLLYPVGSTRLLSSRCP